MPQGGFADMLREDLGPAATTPELPQGTPEGGFAGMLRENLAYGDELGFIDAMRETFEEGGWREKLPFFGAGFELGQAKALHAAAGRLEAGNQTREDEELVLAFLHESQREQGMGYMVGEILTSFPGFLIEFMASGGVWTAGKKAGLSIAGKGLREAVEGASRKSGLRLLRRQVEQRAVGGAAAVAARGAAGAAVNTAGQLAAMAAMQEVAGGSRIRANAWERALPEWRLSADQAGQLHLTFESTVGDFWEALPTALADEFIEILSERSGGALMAGAARVPGAAKLAAAQGQVAEWWARKYPGRVGELLQQVAKKGGWHGPVSEYLEERFGGALRGATGVEEGGMLANAFPDLEQQAAELIAFSAIGGAGAAAGALTSPGAPVEVPEEGFVPASQPTRNLTEAERETLVREFEGQNELAPGALEVVEPDTEEDNIAANRGMDVVYVRQKPRQGEDGEEAPEPLGKPASLPREGVAIVDVEQRGLFDELLSHEITHDLRKKSPKTWEQLFEGLVEHDAESLDAFTQGYGRDYEAVQGFRLTDLDRLTEEGVARYAEERAGLLWLARTVEGRQRLADVWGNRRSVIQTVRDWLVEGLRVLGAPVRTTQERRLAEIDRLLGTEGTRPEHLRGALLMAEAIDTLVGLQAPSERLAQLPEGSRVFRLTQGEVDEFLPEKAPSTVQREAREAAETERARAKAQELPKLTASKRLELQRKGGEDVPFHDFIRARGGIEDHAGDLRDLNELATKRGIGLSRLVHPEGSGKGMPYDEAIEAAVQAGYFPGRDTNELDINDLIEALEQNPVAGAALSEQDLEQQDAERAESEQETLDAMARKEGFEDAEAAFAFYGLQDAPPFAVRRLAAQVEEERQRQLGMWEAFREAGDVEPLPESAEAMVETLDSDRPEYLGNAMAREFKDYGKVSLVGQTIRHSHDLARLSQVFRNPAFETFRFFFTKGGKIVHQIGITSRMPGVAAAYIGDPPDDAVQSNLGKLAILEQGVAAGADGYWIQHNHPSGSPTPSPEDIGVTKALAALGYKLELRGHVVVNHRRYAVIDPAGSVSFHDIENLEPGQLTKSHSLLGASIPTQGRLVQVAKDLSEGRDGYFHLIGVGAGSRGTVGILEVPLSSLQRSSLRLVAETRRFARNTGAISVFAANLPDKITEEGLATFGGALRYRLLVDAVTQSGVSVFDKLRLLGRAPLPRSYMGTRSIKGIEVPATQAYPKDPLFAVRRHRTVGFDVGPEPVKLGVPVGKLIRLFVDQHVPVKRFEQAIQGSGGVVDPDLSAYAALERFPGKVESRLRRWRQRHLEPLIELMAKHGITPEQLDEYLYARHAPERNRFIAERDPDKWDLEENPGSGMANSEAKRIRRNVHRRKNGDAFRQAAKMVDATNRATRRLQKAAGLISQETLETWDAQYDHYVPLRTSYEDEAPGSGRGMQIAGPETRRAKGRTTLAHSPLTYSLMRAQRAIVRGSKNEVGNTLLSLVEENEDLLGKQVEVREIEEEHDTELGEQLPKAPLLREYEFSTKVQGRQVAIAIKDPRLRAALQNLGQKDLGPALRALAKINRFLASLATSWNPGFMVSNFGRDLLTATINLAGEQSPAFARRVTAAALSGAPQRAVNRGLKGEEDAGDEWLSLFHRLDRAGGLTGWYTLPDYTQQMREVQTAVKDLSGSPLRQAKRIALAGRDMVNRWNQAVENGVRLAAFKVALEEGWSEKRAASLAKNLTVNFNRRGELGAAFNSVYLFFAASVAGTARMAQALRFKEVRRIAYGIIAASAIMDAINRAISGDDEDGVPFYDKIPEWVKDRNLIIMEPGGGIAFMVPLPYGYNVFHSIGRNLGAWSDDATTLPDAASSVVATAWESFYPLGSEASLAQTLVPTLADPFVQIGENKTFYGGPIRPEPYDDALVPPSERYWPSVSPISRGFTSWLNRVTGGSEVEAGRVSISPEDVEHMVSFAVGGAGQQALRVQRIIEKWSAGEDILFKDVPILRRLIREPDERYDVQRYYEQRDDVRRAEKLQKEYQGDREKLEALRAEKGELLRLVPSMKAAEGRLRKVRRARKAAEEAGEKERVQQLREQEASIRAAFSRRYMEIIEQ